MGVAIKQNEIAFTKESTFNTAVEPSTDDKAVGVISWSASNGDVLRQTDEGNYGIAIPTKVCLLEHEEGSGTIKFNFSYDNKQFMEALASVFGIYNYTEVEVGKAWTHKFTWKDTISSLVSHTFAYDFEATVRALSGLVFNEVIIGVEGAMYADSNFVYAKHLPAPGFTAPLAATSSGPDIGCFTLQRQMSPRVNAYSGAALSSGDVIDLSDITMRFMRGNTTRGVVSGGDSISGVNDTGPAAVEITGTWRIVSPQNTGLLNDHQAGSTKKMDVNFTTGVLIAGASSTNYSAKFEFPMLQVISAPDHPHEEVITASAVYSMLEPSAAPSGMTTTTPYIEITNGIAPLTGYPTS